MMLSAPAQAQTYTVTVESGIHYLKGTIVEASCNPSYTSASEYTPFVTAGAFYLLPELRLILSNGKWIPGSVSSTGIGSIGTADSESTITSTLSADGIVVGTETGTIIGPSPGTITGRSTLDLNTGAFTWVRTISRSYSDPPCPRQITDTQDRRALLPIRKSPFTTLPPRLVLTNPFANYVNGRFLPSQVTPFQAGDAPVATRLAADGATAVVVAFRTNQRAPVSLALTAPALGTACCSIGSLAPYDPQYLSTMAPANGLTSLTVAQPAFCDPNGVSNCVYLALLWAPREVPVSATDLHDGRFPAVEIKVTATQPSSTPLDTSIRLVPPPLLLVHGVWSNAAAAWTDLLHWLRTDPVHRYPHQLIGLVDYGPYSHRSFRDPVVQNQFSEKLARVLLEAAQAGAAARRVDVVAHSMGGLVTRYFLENTLKSIHYLPAKPVRELITIGTPHTGSRLGIELWANKNQVPSLSPKGLAFGHICQDLKVIPCTLGNFFAWQKKFIDTAVEDLQTGLAQKDGVDYRAIVGNAPAVSATEVALDLIVGGFLDPKSVDSILGPGHDTIVHESSQRAEYGGLSAAREVLAMADIVHTAVAPWDAGETPTPAVWRQALYWLMGGVKASPQPVTTPRAQTAKAAVPPPMLDLTGYTPVASSTFSVSPASGSSLTIGRSASIVATSATKTLTQFLLFQTAAAPTDAMLLYAPAAPFSIPFQPMHLGTAEFLAVAMFSDQTYATTVLQYPLQPVGVAVALMLRDAPATGFEIGSTVTVHAEARYANNAVVDITQTASYTARSGTSTVFAIAPGGAITATGTGVDWLDVSHGGKTVSAPIAVGTCTYALGPSNQLVPVAGGALTINVLTQPGCVWNADEDDSWVSLTGSARGVGPESFSVQIAANISGAPRLATVRAGTGKAVITQLSTNCTYTGLPAQVAVPPAGGSGSLQVGTGFSCPVVAATTATWLTTLGSTSPVVYSAEPNPLGVARSATVTIGTQTVTFVQAGNTTIPPVSANPFGIVDTPLDNRSGVTGAVPFTGWALDDVAVTRIAICRDAFGAEVAPIDPNCGGQAQIFVGFATVIESARPDVAAIYSSYPHNTRAGWGFMVLTNMLPNQGNGTYRFTIWAYDGDGHAVVLATRTMTCANATATLPFGNIDTPSQGGSAAGTQFVNFGWVLTPLPKMIPVDGSTMQVMIDGLPAGTVDYNHERSDITALFPGFQNTRGAVGFRIIDTTKLLNGLHTISWTVTDDSGATEGIGSRFFTVSNGVSGAMRAIDAAIANVDPASLPLETTIVSGRVGWDLEAPYRRLAAEPSGQLIVRSDEVGRIELTLGSSDNARSSLTGYLRTATGLLPLPAGSQLDPGSGVFTWAPGAGFIGAYDLVFVRVDGDTPVARRNVRVVLAPKGLNPAAR